LNLEGGGEKKKGWIYSSLSFEKKRKPPLSLERRDPEKGNGPVPAVKSIGPSLSSFGGKRNLPPEKKKKKEKKSFFRTGPALFSLRCSFLEKGGGGEGEEGEPPHPAIALIHRERKEEWDNHRASNVTAATFTEKKGDDRSAFSSIPSEKICREGKEKSADRPPAPRWSREKKKEKKKRRGRRRKRVDDLRRGRAQAG